MCLYFICSWIKSIKYHISILIQEVVLDDMMRCFKWCAFIFRNNNHIRKTWALASQWVRAPCTYPQSTKYKLNEPKSSYRSCHRQISSKGESGTVKIKISFNTMPLPISRINSPGFPAAHSCVHSLLAILEWRCLCSREGIVPWSDNTLERQHLYLEIEGDASKK
jgi:hypothetical protein